MESRQSCEQIHFRASCSKVPSAQSDSRVFIHSPRILRQFLQILPSSAKAPHGFQVPQSAIKRNCFHPCAPSRAPRKLRACNALAISPQSDSRLRCLPQSQDEPNSMFKKQSNTHTNLLERERRHTTQFLGLVSTRPFCITTQTPNPFKRANFWSWILAPASVGMRQMSLEHLPSLENSLQDKNWFMTPCSSRNSLRFVPAGLAPRCQRLMRRHGR